MKDRTKKVGATVLGAGMLALVGVGASAQAPAQAEVYRLAEIDGRAEEGRYTVQGQTVRFLDEDGEPEEDDRDDDTQDLDVDDLTVGTRSAGALSVRLMGGQTVVFRP